MKNRQIPNTDIHVSPICFGTMSFGVPITEPEGIRLLHYALEHGINFIDTANMYEGYSRHVGSAGGVSEEIIGKALVGRRDKAIVATKVGMKVGDAPEDEHTSPAAILKQLDISLERLKTDFVDIYYLHRPDPTTPMIEILFTLNDLIGKGKIRSYGISNYSAEQIQDMLTVADANNLPRPVICQPLLNLMNQENLAELLPLCEKESIAVTPYKALCSGLLVGLYKRGQKAPDGSRRKEAPGWMPDLTDEIFDEIEKYEKQAEEAGISIVHYAIKWVLNQPAVISALLSVGSTDHIDDVIKAAS